MTLKTRVVVGERAEGHRSPGLHESSVVDRAQLTMVDNNDSNDEA